MMHKSNPLVRHLQVCLFVLTSLTAMASVHADDAKAELVKEFQATKAKAEAGDIDAQYALAKLYASGKGTEKNEVEAVAWFRKVAAKNDARGQSMLGVMYTNARGVERDYNLAIIWFRKAAAQNSAHAKYNLGFMYATGKGVQQDQAEAAKWYRQAAEQNDTGSQLILGSRYVTGQGVPTDLVQAYAWTKVAIPARGEAAEKQLTAIEAKMTKEQITAAEKLAEEISARIAMGNKP